MQGISDMPTNTGNRLRVMTVDDNNHRFASPPGVRTAEGDEVARQRARRIVSTEGIGETPRARTISRGGKITELTELDWLLNGVGPKPDFSN